MDPAREWWFLRELSGAVVVGSQIPKRLVIRAHQLVNGRGLLGRLVWFRK